MKRWFRCISKSEPTAAGQIHNHTQMKYIYVSLMIERDILRLKINWLFVIAACVMKSVNYICVIPTNHQFIINPSAKSLNITDEVREVTH